MRLLVFLCGCLFLSGINADVYLHNPRGSNGRVNEANENRNNANRLMDTQNNAKGGYCLGPAMSFYERSLLSIEWTSQHGCGNPAVVCNVVLQYMCSGRNDVADKQIRDGTTTDRIPEPGNGNTPNEQNPDGSYKYGMHEPYSNYLECKTRSRNLGLFIADRNLNGKTAQFTRQNNNGNRHGYECPEERDYYPYWHPTPWKDIAVLTDDEGLCEFFKKESQNVKNKGRCAPDANGTPSKFNTERSCTENGGTWEEIGKWGIPAPDCVKNAYNRDNHLGNGGSGFANSYNWTLPTRDNEDCIKSDDCACTLRLRYNISTGDLGNWGDVAEDSTSNGQNSPVKDDPDIDVQGYNLSLALDTSQYGRTFSDRTHVFYLRKRPSSININERIYNLNVRGKRGNIVQAYPAVEYDFVPNILAVRPNDYVHFQWTGCDTNPAGNAGEGTDQTDRSNIVQIAGIDDNYPASDSWLSKNSKLFEGKSLRKRMAFLDQNLEDKTSCYTLEALQKANNNNENNIEKDVHNCAKLNAASNYFDGGLIKMNNTGKFFYMSTRNNNFSNRGQKGTIIVNPLLPPWALALVIVGSILFVGSGGLAGATLYAKTHPHSGVANLLAKIKI